MPLPDRPTLRELVRKSRAEQAFTGTDYRWLTNILVTLEHDSMYRIRERMRQSEKDEKG